ncbi:potassium channel family protein [Thermithiobacillus plumbiphilus]|uniref:Potassium channel family protein n=1 Tax=Thermithiobacillus plumbiphilus TaxID=1729899 RepID=A0ABU9D6F4_9PROT
MSMVLVIALWAILQVLGWALIYYPHMPEGFTYSPGLDPSKYNDFAEALYVSLVTLTTLGYGDVVAADKWVRLFSPAEALIGFSLLTAALSWFSQMYPIQARRRTLALKLRALEDARYASCLDELEAATVSRSLDSLAEDFIRIRIDLTQNAELYYFRESDPQISLATSVHYALELSSTALRSSRTDVQRSGILLSSALDRLGAYMRDNFPISGKSTKEIFEAVSTDHGYTLHSSPEKPF